MCYVLEVVFEKKQPGCAYLNRPQPMRATVAMRRWRVWICDEAALLLDDSPRDGAQPLTGVL